MKVQAYAQQLTEKYDPEVLKDLLDESCIELATSEAAEANNGGIEAQLRFLCDDSDEIQPWLMFHIQTNMAE